jgi:xylitol oxidase
VRNGNLATSVRSVELLTADGDELVWNGRTLLSRVVVSLGALGVVTAITLDLQQTYDVRQHVYEELPFEAPWPKSSPTVTASASSQTLWRPVHAGVAQARGVDDGSRATLGARAATKKHHPIAGADASALHRAVRRRRDHGTSACRTSASGFTPSSGDELQSEYFVPLTAAPMPWPRSRR